MTVDNARLAFSSQVPIDKVVATYTGSFTVSAGGSTSTTITHNLGRKCYSEMIWSTDGVHYQDGGMPLPSATGDTLAIQAVDTNTAVVYGGTSEATNQTIGYTLLLLWPS